MPTLAGLFELADLVTAGDTISEEIPIGLTHTQQAAAFCEYLESHAERVYSCLVSPELRSARELVRHLQNGDLPGSFTTRDLYLKGWSGLDKPKVRAQRCTSFRTLVGFAKRTRLRHRPAVALRRFGS